MGDSVFKKKLNPVMDDYSSIKRLPDKSSICSAVLHALLI